MHCSRGLHASCNASGWPLPEERGYVVQSVSQGERDFCAFRGIMADLLKEIHERGEPSDLDTTIAAHLLRIRDPVTCRPLPDDRIAAEIGVFFTGGFETTGHTIAWVQMLTHMLFTPQHKELVCSKA